MLLLQSKSTFPHNFSASSSTATTPMGSSSSKSWGDACLFPLPLCACLSINEWLSASYTHSEWKVILFHARVCFTFHLIIDFLLPSTQHITSLLNPTHTQSVTPSFHQSLPPFCFLFAWQPALSLCISITHIHHTYISVYMCVLHASMPDSAIYTLTLTPHTYARMLKVLRHHLFKHLRAAHFH